MSDGCGLSASDGHGLSVSDKCSFDIGGCGLDSSNVNSSSSADTSGRGFARGVD